MAYNKDYNIGDIFGGIGSIASMLTGMAGIITNAVQGKKQRESNMQAVRETNAANLQQVREQNAAAAAESEKQRAYESASAQVSRLRSAGMSKAGALGAINGAGGYTPAPVNAAQAQAPTAEYQPIDFSGLVNAMQGMAQLSMQKEQLNQQKYEYERNQKLEEDKFFEEQKNNEKARELTDANIARLAKENEVSDAQIKQIIAGTSLTWQQVENACADYNIKVAELAQIKEQTKLTTEEILRAKAATRLTNAQIDEVRQHIDNMKSEKKLTDEQARIAEQEFYKLQTEVSEFILPENIMNRQKARRLELKLKEYQEQIGMLDVREKQNEEHYKQQQHDMETNPAGYVLRMWSYVVSKMLPVGDILGISK